MPIIKQAAVPSSKSGEKGRDHSGGREQGLGAWKGGREVAEKGKSHSQPDLSHKIVVGKVGRGRNIIYVHRLE